MSSTEQASQRAEESVLGALLRSEDVRIEVIGMGLETEHFYYRPYRTIFDEIVERYYADEMIDPLTVAESIGPRIAEQWHIAEREAVDKVVKLATDEPESVTAAEHAKIVKRHADYRELTRIASKGLQDAIEQGSDPEEIAGLISIAATRIITGALAQPESYSYLELGRRWTRMQQEEIAARAAGAQIGVRFGIKGVDDYVKGLRPTELMILGGEAGVGKSAIAWAMGRNFARAQMDKEPEKRIGTFILSAEMGEEPSSSRFAQMESGVQGDKLREGDLTRAELREIAARWSRNREIPLYVNHSGSLRETQIKALIVDHMRRGHNIGLVIIDHFRFIKTDERFENKNDADEQVVAFLKSLAKDLNIALVCLAHTRGDRGTGDDRRPVMDDLRGSKMISAFADIVAFPYSPWRHATQGERDRGYVNRNDYELIFAKVRQGDEGTADLWMDLATMAVR